MAIHPYEDITNTRRQSAVRHAREALARGWSRKGKPVIRLDGPIPWALTEPSDRSWNFHIHSWDMIDGLLKAHCVGGERRFLDGAAGVIRDWIARGETAESPNAWYDMAVGLRAYRLAYVLDAGRAGRLLPDADTHAFEALLERHRAYLADDANIVFHNNHGLYQVAGQLAMARRFPDRPEMVAAFTQGQERLVRLMDAHFAPDGAHKEHSPDYHRMLVLTLRGLADAGLVTDAPALERIEVIERALSWFVTPQGDLVNFGDTDQRALITRPEHALIRWRTPEMRARASESAVGAAPPETVKAFEQGGYFIVRKGAERPSNDSYLAQIAAFHSRTHKHADDLSFVWHDRGTPILVDAGRYGYVGKAAPGSALHDDGYWYANPNRVFVETTRAHNTVEFDGRNHKRKGVRPYGSAIRGWTEHDGIVAVETCVTHGPVRHERILVFDPGHWLVIVDNWRDAWWTPRHARQWFHAHPDFVTRREGDGYRMEGPATLSVLPLTPAEAGPVIRGRAEPMQGWMSPREREMIPNDAFAFERIGRRGMMATLFAFGEADAANCRVRPILGGLELEIAGEGGHRRLRLKHAGRRLVLDA